MMKLALESVLELAAPAIIFIEGFSHFPPKEFSNFPQLMCVSQLFNPFPWHYFNEVSAEGSFWFSE